jgi:putative cell wall-binding protein
VRRTAAGILASALALSGAVAAATPSNAAPGFALDRLAGDDRYETSAAIAAAFGPSTGAILASGEAGRSVDALSANFLAGVREVPVLLTQRDRIPAPVLARLNALTGARNVTIVGGTVAVSAAVETQLRSAGFAVTRLSGADRYATSEAIITAGRATASPIGLVASGTSFPDALAGAPLSYKGKHPVFLTSGGGLPQDTIDAMVAAGTRQVIILGGTAAVPASVQTALAARGITVVTRLGGAGRSETSRIVADYLIANQGFTSTTFNLASGTPRGEGADALSGGALSGKQNRALLITDTATSAAPVVSFARDRSATLNAVGNIFGGPAAVAVQLEEAIEAAGRAAGNFQTLSVTPTEAATLTLADDEATGATEAASDNRTYTVTGLNNALTYRITLVNASSIQGTGSDRTFLSSAIEPATTPPSFAVNTGADIADIVSVGGTNAVITTTGGTNTLNTATVVPVNGSITFTIDGTGTGTVVPAVYVNGGQGGTATTGGANNRLETAATAAGQFAAVTETYGLGGPTTFVNPPAASGNVGSFNAGAAAVQVQSVNKGANQFDANGFSYTYDANDVFRVGGVPVSLDEFESNLSSGDAFSASYSATASVTSTFDLTDTNPGTPTAAPAVSVGTGANSNDVTLTATITGDVDQVLFQRATVTGGSVGTFATVATEAATDDDAATNGTQVVFVDNNVAAGTFQYRVILVNDGDQGGASPATATVTTTTPTAADTTAPTLLDARVSDNDQANALLLESGEGFTLTFSEEVAAPATNATIRLTDADGSVYDLPAGTNVSYTRNTSPVTIGGTSYAANRVVTVAITTLPAASTAGSITGLNIPSTIASASGFADLSNNALTLSGSADVVIDNE